MNPKGFTLIEILIVIVIISIASSMAVLTISHNQKKQIETLTNSLTRLIVLAEEEAMLRPATLGLAFTPGRFQFFQYQDHRTKNQSRWLALTDKLFGPHDLPKNIQITLKVQNKEASLNGKPQIIFSMSGDITPFRIFIGKQDAPPDYIITGFANGAVKKEQTHAKQ
jgi:general secretion pathway protein H